MKGINELIENFWEISIGSAILISLIWGVYMKSKIAIYLAGTIQKGHEINETFWTEADRHFIKSSLENYEIIFLNPAYRTDDLSDQFSVFGRDMLQVFSSDFVFVDARDRRGLGVGAEMMWAKMNSIPVITWAPKNTHYRKDSTTILDVSINDYVHPFVHALSDKIVDNLTEATVWIEYVISNPMAEIKNAQTIESAMDYYKATQLDKDIPMRELIQL